MRRVLRTKQFDAGFARVRRRKIQLLILARLLEIAAYPEDEAPGTHRLAPETRFRYFKLERWKVIYLPTSTTLWASVIEPFLRIV